MTKWYVKSGEFRMVLMAEDHRSASILALRKLFERHIKIDAIKAVAQSYDEFADMVWSLMMQTYGKLGELTFIGVRGFDYVEGETIHVETRELIPHVIASLRT